MTESRDPRFEKPSHHFLIIKHLTQVHWDVTFIPISFTTNFNNFNREKNRENRLFSCNTHIHIFGITGNQFIFLIWLVLALKLLFLNVPNCNYKELQLLRDQDNSSQFEGFTKLLVWQGILCACTSSQIGFHMLIGFVLELPKII